MGIKGCLGVGCRCCVAESILEGEVSMIMGYFLYSKQDWDSIKLSVRDRSFLLYHQDITQSSTTHPS